MQRRGNDFSVEGGKLVKNNQNNQIQNIILCNMYLSKRYIRCTMESGPQTKPPEAREFSRIFVLKVTLRSVRLLLTVSYRNNWGSRMYYPNNFGEGAAANLAPTVPAHGRVVTVDTCTCSW